jgi:uncharacterized protein YlxW (UPF0749 family)
MWVITILLVGALLIALTAIVVDSPIGRSLARRVDQPGEGSASDLRHLQQKVELLETEVDDLQRSLDGMREEMQFVHRLLEDPARKKTPAS